MWKPSAPSLVGPKIGSPLPFPSLSHDSSGCHLSASSLGRGHLVPVCQNWSRGMSDIQVPTLAIDTFPLEIAPETVATRQLERGHPVL